MRELNILMNLGPSASPESIEVVARGLRVAADVAYDSEVERVRRAARDRLRFPTDSDLWVAVERMSTTVGRSMASQVRQLLDTRSSFRQEYEDRFLPDWLDLVYGPRVDLKNREQSLTGDYRFSRSASPFQAGPGLDSLSPEIYSALVADDIAAHMPGRVRVSSLRYENPFWASLFGFGKAEKTVSATARVVELTRDYGALRKIGQAEAEVAQRTVGDRIAEQNVATGIRYETLEQERLKTERMRLENEKFRQDLAAENYARGLAAEAYRRGEMHIADAISILRKDDAAALGAMSQRQLEVSEALVDDHESSGGPVDS